MPNATQLMDIPMPMTDDELYKDILHRWNTLADAVEKLYFAGYWHCDRPVDERALWQAVRDAARIPPGMTGYTLGEDRSHGPSHYRDALEQIKRLKAEPIGDSGFSVGPLSLFNAAQRIARAALKEPSPSATGGQSDG